MEEKILEDGTTIDVEVSVSPEDAKKIKKKQVRYIFKDPEKGWFEKERDNVRVTKYYRTQKEAIDAARTHIKNSGLPGSIVVQSKKGTIRANDKVPKKKPVKKTEAKTETKKAEPKKTAAKKAGTK